MQHAFNSPRLALRYAEIVDSRPTEHVMTRQKQPVPRNPMKARPSAEPVQSAESRLDEALEESFPASDPIAVDMTDPHHVSVKEVSSAGKKRH
jgi:hypothetical protein